MLNECVFVFCLLFCVALRHWLSFGSCTGIGFWILFFKAFITVGVIDASFFFFSIIYVSYFSIKYKLLYVYLFRDTSCTSVSQIKNKTRTPALYRISAEMVNMVPMMCMGFLLGIRLPIIHAHGMKRTIENWQGKIKRTQ
jgi:hypothetical protein